MSYHFTLLLLVLICSSCRKPNEDYESFWKEEKVKIEQILNNYSDPADSLKRKAALFLLEHIPEHRTFRQEVVRKYYDDIHAISSTQNMAYLKAEKISEIHNKFTRELEEKRDIELISPEFLINHVDRSFRIREENEWTRNLTFDEFCEYILPYKLINREPLDYWQEYYGQLFTLDDGVLRNCTYHKDSPFQAALLVNRLIREKLVYKDWNKSWYPKILPSYLLSALPESCNESALLTAAVMRSQGIPVSIDFTPQWGFQEQGHSWNSLFMSDGKELPFGGPFEDPGTEHRPDDKMGKVFRHTFRYNREIGEIHKACTEIPELFDNPFLVDVTEKYARVYDIKIPIHAKLRRTASYAWISHFSTDGWNPVHWGKIERGKALFRAMSGNILYLAGYYADGRVYPLNYPFILERDGKIRYLHPNKECIRKVTLRRKYFLTPKVYRAAEQLTGGMIQASDREDFRDANTIYRIPCAEYSGTLTLSDTVPAFRYWRYLPSSDRHCQLAEFMFFKEKKQLSGEIIGNSAIDKNDAKNGREAAFDNNWFTYFESGEPGEWVGVDFGEPVRPDYIVYIPRTDDNGIHVGDLYELFYHDLGGWVSLGKQSAETTELVYDHVPDNALLWLRNLTRGKDERPFTYENDEQIWW